jgi:hypothetical protein
MLRSSSRQYTNVLMNVPSTIWFGPIAHEVAQDPRTHLRRDQRERDQRHREHDARDRDHRARDRAQEQARALGAARERPISIADPLRIDDLIQRDRGERQRRSDRGQDRRQEPEAGAQAIPVPEQEGSHGMDLESSQTDIDREAL